MKQILLVNDVVGCSHVGMVAMLPILTHLGHATFNLPTALVSNTLDYGKFNILETTDYMRGTIPVWRQLGFRFDAICTGLMRDSIGKYMDSEGDQSKKLYPLFDREAQLQVQISREMYSTKVRIDKVLTKEQRKEFLQASKRDKRHGKKH